MQLSMSPSAAQVSRCCPPLFVGSNSEEVGWKGEEMIKSLTRLQCSNERRLLPTCAGIFGEIFPSIGNFVERDRYRRIFASVSTRWQQTPAGHRSICDKNSNVAILKIIISTCIFARRRYIPRANKLRHFSVKGHMRLVILLRFCSFL